MAGKVAVQAHSSTNKVCVALRRKKRILKQGGGDWRYQFAPLSGDLQFFEGVKKLKKFQITGDGVFCGGTQVDRRLVAEAELILFCEAIKEIEAVKPNLGILFIFCVDTRDWRFQPFEGDTMIEKPTNLYWCKRERKSIEESQ
ncbi:hypothetical protein L2E82_47119 [Cichorium intybus]|uniref:Uncharacterized protein n=1 Tax=Cichorium intybus TaxID=13427 RepID=A0ACB8YW36_CICIN|nr:hypothetical protein L2E82_47119 [Cichorium intybus]